MLVDFNGPDFLRVQKSATTRISDPLDPDVFLSGAFDDGQALFFEQAVSAPGNTVTNYTINFGQTLSAPPLVNGGIKLTQAVTQRDPENKKNVTYFDVGEIVSPCLYQYTKSGSGRIINYVFMFYVYRDSIVMTIGGFVGTAKFLVLDV